MDELSHVLEELANASSVGQTRVVLDDAIQTLKVNGHPDAPEEVLQRAINWYEARPCAEVATSGHRWSYAWMLFHAGDPVEAQEIFDELAEDYPDSIRFRGRRGSALRLAVIQCWRWTMLSDSLD